MATLLSFENLFRTYGPLAASTEASGCPVTNLVVPNHYLPWRSTVATVSNIVIDLGAARPMDRILLLDSNFTSFRIEQNATNSWGAPTYVSPTQTIDRDPNRRAYRRWFAATLPATLSLRWTRLVIPTQTPVDGAGYFQLGTLWGGLFTATPRTPYVEYGDGVVTPKHREEAASGGGAVEIITGDSYAVQRYTRFAEMSRITPGVGDEWAAWKDLDRQIEAAGQFAYVVDGWGTPAAPATQTPSGAWIMRQTNQTAWSVSWPVARDAWDLEEIVK